MKHDNVLSYNSLHWNWLGSSLYNDSLFIAKIYINRGLEGKMHSHDANKHLCLGMMNPYNLGCIGLIDGTLVEIWQPWNNPQHSKSFNDRKMCYMNNTVMVSHNGLIKDIDLGHPGSFHDVLLLQHLELYQNWRRHFTHSDEYLEYVLGDPGYQGENMFIMKCIGCLELPPDIDDLVLNAFNKMHAGFRVQVECMIGGLKRK